MLVANHGEVALSSGGWHPQLLQLWRKFLKTEDVSIDDDFFEKGGDSLVAIDLQLELQRLIGQELPEAILFEASTVRALAKRLQIIVGANVAAVHGGAAVRPDSGFAARGQSAND